jgi:hypothetical protein
MIIRCISCIYYQADTDAILNLKSSHNFEDNIKARRTILRMKLCGKYRHLLISRYITTHFPPIITTHHPLSTSILLGWLMICCITPTCGKCAWTYLCVNSILNGIVLWLSSRLIQTRVCGDTTVSYIASSSQLYSKYSFQLISALWRLMHA